jgi:hypothetical protein
MTSLLGAVRRRQIDCDALGRQSEAGSDQRRPYAFARFGHGLVGEAYEIEGGKPRRDLDLHVHRPGLDPLKGNGRNMLDHEPNPQLQINAKGSNSQEQ